MKAFGTLVTSTGSTPNDYRFAGEQFDSSLVYYLRARYLNPGTGRFWTRDRFEGNQEEPFSLHRYLYAASDPVDRIDPSEKEFTIAGVLTVISGSFILAQISNPVSVTAQKKAEEFVAIERKPANQFSISPQGLQFISNFEGFNPTIYQDAAGLDTIGFGHKLKSGEQQKFANGITRPQGYALLRSDARIAENAVGSAVTAPLNQNEFDALVSFTYNVGAGAFRGSTLLKKLNAGDYDGASDEFPRWNRAGGRVLQGLTERRRKERILFRGELWLFRSELGFDPY